MTEAQHVFVPRETLPDDINSIATHSEKASLLGARLYVNKVDGVLSPAVKLEKRSYHVQGQLLSADKDFSQLLQKTDALEKFPGHSEKDVVEVTTQGGKKVNAYVYHVNEVTEDEALEDNIWRQT